HDRRVARRGGYAQREARLQGPRSAAREDPRDRRGGRAGSCRGHGRATYGRWWYGAAGVAARGVRGGDGRGSPRTGRCPIAKIEDKIRVNGQIRSREVRVIGADGSQLGVMTSQDALRMAQQKELTWSRSRPPRIRRSAASWT